MRILSLKVVLKLVKWSVMDNTIMENLEMEIKTSNITASYFKNEDRNPLAIYSGNEVLDYHRKPYESDFEYSLFQLYCFYDYSIEDLYNLVQEISSKYSKNDLYHLGYSDFVQYVEIKRFNWRKETYIRSSDEYKGKIKRKANVESENIVHVTDDYDSTIKVIDCLNQDILDICNDEDMSPEKRLKLINQYSKVSIRLNEKRFGLLSKIREEVL